VPEAMVLKGFREKMQQLERQEADYLQVSTIVIDYVNDFANTNTLLFSALFVKTSIRLFFILRDTKNGRSTVSKTLVLSIRKITKTKSLVAHIM